jgi:hypothetical protein
VKKCVCGRDSSHCLFCGSRGIYVLLHETQTLTSAYNMPITAYRCKRCSRKFNTTETCKAPILVEAVTTFEIADIKDTIMEKYGLKMMDSPEQVCFKMATKGATQNEVKYVLSEKFGYLIGPDVSDEVSPKPLDTDTNKGNPQPQKENAHQGVSTESPEGDYDVVPKGFVPSRNSDSDKSSDSKPPATNTESVHKANTIELNDILKAMKKKPND